MSAGLAARTPPSLSGGYGRGAANLRQQDPAEIADRAAPQVSGTVRPDWAIR